MASRTNLKALLSLGLFPFLSLSCWLSLGLERVSAQITPDNTLGAEQSRVTTVNDIRERIEGGAIRGSNLFHSFKEFNIGEGREAYFVNPAGIETIFGRVTGNDISAIFGTLGVEGMANLFLINPNGIVFGPNARLDIGGSFVASTAERFTFPGGSSFSAVKPEAAPLLTINVTPGLQYGTRQPAPLVNTGRLEVNPGQGLTLTGGTVLNTGELIAPGGQISIAAVPSQSLVNLDLTGKVSSVDLSLTTDDTNPVVSSAPALAALLERASLAQAGIPIDVQVGTVANFGAVDASNPLGSGGAVTLTGNRIHLLDGTVNAGGITGGEVNLTSTFLENRGQMRADGERGGSLAINTTNFLDAGVLSATGSAGDGGRIQVDYEGTVIQTASALTSVTGSEVGGRIAFQGGRVLTTSAKLEANGEFGGEIHLFGERLQLLATQVNASGNSGGGEILVGGDYQGNTEGAENALSTWVNHATTLRADALTVGDGGRVIVWADGETDFYGSLTARGGELGGNGGLLEVSGRESLVFGGWGDASAAKGGAGELLLDPKNITIDTAVSGNSFQLFDPNPAPGNQFGANTAVLANNNIVVSSSGDDLTAQNAGAVYLFDSNTGALLGSINGANPFDQFGWTNITVLNDGNFVFGNLFADIGGIENAGTVILANGTTGTEINRISGTNPADSFGYGDITALSNGNYVFGNPLADIGGVENAGTVILADGTTGTEISRISGTNPGDGFGSGYITALNNGNYVFGNPLADIGGVVDAGTVILVDGTTGTEISRISGTNPGDGFSSRGITILSNSNYVFGNPLADIGGVENTGTVILANGTTGTEISRISGVNPFDFFGGGIITALSNGNYVFGNASADIGGVENAGTVILANGTTGTEISRISGVNPFDFFGDGIITALSNSNYVFGNASADIGGVVDAGTVILADGTTGTEISRISGANPSNSFGLSITALSNGNYVFNSPFADIGGVVDAGTVILADGTTGTEISRISGANPLDQFSWGWGGNITALSNGNYAFSSAFADIGGVVDAGTVILADGTTGTEISRISGANPFDFFGGNITALSNGNYLIGTPNANNHAGRVDIGIANPNSLTYGYFPDRNITITPTIITSITNTGTTVTLQANNDITVNQAITTDNSTSTGGSLSLQAGRSIRLNADITTDNGNLSLFANQPLASGVINSERAPGAAEITMAPSTTINAGSGDVTIKLDTGAGLTNNTVGTVTLGNINAERLTVHSEGAILGNGILRINGDASFTSNLANTGTVSVTNTRPTTIGYSIIGGNFTLNSATPISQAPGEPLQVAGTIAVNGAGSSPLINTIGLPSINTTLPNGDVVVTKVGTVNLNAQTVSGNLIVNSLPVGVLEFTEVFEPAAINLNQANSFGGTLRLRTNLGGANTVEATPGITQSGTQVVNNTATLNAYSGDIGLNDAANRFGSVDFSGKNVVLREQNATTLQQSEASGNFTLTSGGLITQAGRLAITGNADITTTRPQAGTVLFTNTGPTVLGNSLIGGNFTINSGGPISQIPGGILQVAGDTNPSQNNAGFVGNDDIIPRLNLPNGDVIITEVGPISLNAETFSGNLTVTSLAQRLQFIDGVVYNTEAINLSNDRNFFGGVIRLKTDAPTTVVESGTPSITQSGAIQVNGTASFTAENGSITLAQPTNSFNRLAFNSGDILINQGNNTNLLSSTATRNLELTSGGAIAQSGSLIVGGTASFTSLQPDAPINLTSANQFSGALNLSTSGNGDASLVNTLKNTQLGVLNIGGNLSVTSGGGISQTAPITITGITRLNAENQDILLPQTNDFNQLAITGGNQVIINDINNISLDNSRVFGRITVDAGGNIVTQNIDSLSGLIEIISRNGSIDTTAGNLSSSLSTGNGGDVILSAGENLNVGSIDADGLVGGNISLSAEDIISINQSRIASFSTGQGTGRGINIDADLVEVVNGGRIVSSTSGFGNAGDIAINARQLRVQGNPDQITVITTNTTEGSAGNGGNIIINASESVELIGNRQGEFIPDPTNPNAIFQAATTSVGLTTSSFGSGKAGNLTIETERFTIRDGAGAAAAALSSESDAGAGGEIRVSADTIEFQGLAGLATTTFGPGQAGDVIINADNITLKDGATISADALGDPNTVGQAGNIFITARTLLLDNRSRLSTTTQSGDGGNITLSNLDLLLLRHGDGVGGISTTAGTAQRGGDGGNITIDADFIIGVPKENSDITANAFSGRGGNINITTNRILGLEFRDNLTRFSDITASSELGIDGDVVINDLGIDPVQGTVALPTNTQSPPLSEGCQPGIDGRGRFINKARGGIPPNPSDPISSSGGWEDVQPATSSDDEQSEETTSSSEIVEAQGWYLNEQGQVVLSANIPSTSTGFNCQLR